MKKNEIIELNGVEYTLELNRNSLVQIDRACNIEKSMKIAFGGLYDYYDEQELNDDFNPELLLVSDEDIEAQIKLKNETLEKLFSRAYFIWLYPNHKLTINEVKELIKPYLDDEEKSQWLGDKTGTFLRECVEIRSQYNEEQKNLKAQASKK